MGPASYGAYKHPEPQPPACKLSVLSQLSERRQNVLVGGKQRRRWEWRCYSAPESGCSQLARGEHHTGSGRLGFLLLSRGNTRVVGHTMLKSCTPKVDAAAHSWLLTAGRYLAHAGREHVSGLHPFTSVQVLQLFFFSPCLVLTYFPLCLNKMSRTRSYSCWLIEASLWGLAGWGCSVAAT